MPSSKLPSVTELVLNCSQKQQQIEDLQAENQRLKEALIAIAEYPPQGHERRSDDGYPLEMVYDEFAYQRIVDVYREAAAKALGEVRDE